MGNRLWCVVVGPILIYWRWSINTMNSCVVRSLRACVHVYVMIFFQERRVSTKSDSNMTCLIILCTFDSQRALYWATHATRLLHTRPNLKFPKQCKLRATCVRSITTITIRLLIAPVFSSASFPILLKSNVHAVSVNKALHGCSLFWNTQCFLQCSPSLTLWLLLGWKRSLPLLLASQELIQGVSKSAAQLLRGSINQVGKRHHMLGSPERPEEQCDNVPQCC